MTLFRTTDSLTDDSRHGVAVIGNFDGVHRGHQAVLAQARTRADALGQTPVIALIFDPHPRQFFAPHAPSLRLTRLTTRAALLEQYGANHTLALKFDAQMATLSPQAFIQNILVDALSVKAVCIGHDFHFGKDRAGTPAILQQAGANLGFGVHIIDPVTPDWQAARPFSSTAIRECLTRGDVRLARELLGHEWCLEGEVRAGDGRGRTLAFPTANIPLTDYHLPLFGVYAAKSTIKSGRLAGQTYLGVANLGIRPSFDAVAPRLEVHLFDFEGDIYHEALAICLIDFIRPERKFDGRDALQAQIAKDAETAKQMLAGYALG